MWGTLYYFENGLTLEIAMLETAWKKIQGVIMQDTTFFAGKAQ